MDNAKPISEWRNDLQKILNNAYDNGERVKLTDKYGKNIYILSEEKINEMLLNERLCREADLAEEEFERTGESFTNDELKQYLEERRSAALRNKNS